MLIRQNYVSRLTTIFGPRCLGIPHGLDRTLTRASGRGRDERAARNFEIWGSAKEMDPDFNSLFATFWKPVFSSSPDSY